MVHVRHISITSRADCGRILCGRIEKKIDEIGNAHNNNEKKKPITPFISAAFLCFIGVSKIVIGGLKKARFLNNFYAVNIRQGVVLGLQLKLNGFVGFGRQHANLFNIP